MRAFSDVPKALSLAACLATCLALAACAGTQPIPYSGIASSTQLRPSQHDDSGRIPFEYKTQVDWRRYSGFVLDPVAIYRGSDGQFDDISEEDKAFLARSMRDQFTEKLNARFRNPPGRSADAVRIKLTLTGAKTNTAVLSTTPDQPTPEGLGFAIPSAVVAFAYPQLRKYGHVHRGEIGIAVPDVLALSTVANYEIALACAIVSAIIAMARSLNIQVVAEGIETWQQLEILRNMGCALAQGFLFARPCGAAEALRYLKLEPLDLLGGDWQQNPLAETG